jgi:hypothetical protein
MKLKIVFHSKLKFIHQSCEFLISICTKSSSKQTSQVEEHSFLALNGMNLVKTKTDECAINAASIDLFTNTA